MSDINNEVKIGCEGVTITGDRFVIISKERPRYWKIRFVDEYARVIVREGTAIKRGEVRNPYATTVNGVGRVGRCSYTHKEKDFWKRNICQKYAKGKLPHLNKRWLVLEYFLDDIRKLVDYDLFVSRKNISITDPFGRFDKIEHLKVCDYNIDVRGVVVVDLYSKEYDLYSSRFECAYDTGWHDDTIFDFCHTQAERDGYKYYWASDYADLFM